MSNNNRNRATKGCILGIPYTYNDPPFLVKGRYRSRLKIKNPRTGKTEREKLITGSTIETVLAKIPHAVESFLREETDLVIRWIRQGDYDPTVTEYYKIRENRVTAKLSRSYRPDRFVGSWNMIRQAFSHVRLSSVRKDLGSAKDIIKNAVDTVFRRLRAKRPMNEAERLAWIVAKAILEDMAEEGILDSDAIPLSKLIKSNIDRPQSTQISRVFKARSFSRAQAARYLSLVLDLEDNDLKCALLVRYLLGPTVYELCALDIDSYHPARRDFPAMLTIVREYYEKRGSQPVMRDLDCYNQYRTLPCSAVLEEILNIQVKRRKKQGARNEDPLFLYHGDRLKPSEIKKYESRFVSEAFKGCAFTPARTDFIRANAGWHFLNTCMMLPTEDAYMEGIDRIETYARFYTNWRSELVLPNLVGKLDRWHYTEPITSASRARQDCRPSVRIISGTISGEETIHIKNRHGFICSIKFD